jgi:TRAP-type C4-dicarboxylate transport system permease small subunit
MVPTPKETGKETMKKTLRTLFWIIDGLTRFTGWMAALSLVAAAFIVTEAVIARKLFGVSTIWQIQASVYLLMFSVFAGAPFVQMNEAHLNVDLVIIHFSPKTREIIMIIVSSVTCLLVLLLAWYAWPMWWESVVKNTHSESLWGPPLWIPYSFLPLGMSLLFLQYIVYIYKKIEALKKGEIDTVVLPAELADMEKPAGRTDSNPSSQ